MKWSDLFSLSLANLWRRKLRTILTIVGVMIGTCSIVVMISLGLGINKSIEDEYARQGSLTTIELYDYSSNNRGAVKGKTQLNDQTLYKIGQLEHVTYTTPVINMYASMQLVTGRYVAYTNITVMKADAPQQFDMTLSQGNYLSAGSQRQYELLFGAEMASNFQKRNARRWSSVPPDIDWLTAKMTLDLTTYDNITYEARTKSNPVKVAGILGYNNYGSNWGVYCSIDTAKKIYRDNKKAFYEEPNFTTYQNAKVKVDDYKNVQEVLDYIRDELELDANSPVDHINSAKKTSQSLQLMLAGLGSIAMLVAAISIANTMLMSIYERTREIGVMKVLGCRLSNISMLFLGEAAFIGLFGGLMGLGLSYGLSAILNYAFTYSSFGGLGGGGMSSYIPAYLAVASLAFSVLVGVVSGLYPSQRAMRLSALAAIRNDV